MTTEWKPFREPLRATLTRTLTIAAVLGLVFAFAFHGGLRAWPVAFLASLWPAFGGHWVELFFLNWLRPRLPRTRAVQVAARIGVWFVGGCLLAAGMYATAELLRGFPSRWPAWWVGGVGFIAIELVAHLGISLRGQDNFYNGRS